MFVFLTLNLARKIEKRYKTHSLPSLRLSLTPCSWHGFTALPLDLALLSFGSFQAGQPSPPPTPGREGEVAAAALGSALQAWQFQQKDAL